MKKGRNLFKYHATTMATLTDRLELQKIDPPTIEFQFMPNHATAFVSDRVEIREVKLHAGLDIVVILDGEYDHEITNIGLGFADKILDMISFATLAHCGVPRLISHLTLDDAGECTGSFFENPSLEESIVVGTPRTVDKDIFQEVWRACDGHQNETQILKALPWFRKALRERYLLDQFIPFWVALEVIKPVLRDITKQNARNPKEWDGVKEIFDAKIKFVKLEEIAKARNELLHGLKPITPDFNNRIRQYIPAMRSAVVYGIGKIIGLADVSVKSIANYSPRRLLVNSSIGIRGKLENLPNTTDDILKNYPHVETLRKPNRYSIRDDGKLDIIFDINQKAILPEKTTFGPEGIEFEGEENSGIEGFNASEFRDI